MARWSSLYLLASSSRPRSTTAEARTFPSWSSRILLKRRATGLGAASRADHIAEMSASKVSLRFLRTSSNLFVMPSLSLKCSASSLTLSWRGVSSGSASTSFSFSKANLAVTVPGGLSASFCHAGRLSTSPLSSILSLGALLSAFAESHQEFEPPDFQSEEFQLDPFSDQLFHQLSPDFHLPSLLPWDQSCGREDDEDASGGTAGGTAGTATGGIGTGGCGVGGAPNAGPVASPGAGGPRLRL